MRVNVTIADIRKGKRRSYCTCPVGIALRRALDMPEVYIWHTRLGYCWEAWDPCVDMSYATGSLSKRTGDRIRQYDAGSGMDPFTFLTENEV